MIKQLAFLSRVAFLCNMVFVLAISLHWFSIIVNTSAISFILITGYFLGLFVFNPVVNILYIITYIFRRKLFDLVPQWLVASNFFFLLLQVFYFIYIRHDSVTTQG